MKDKNGIDSHLDLDINKAIKKRSIQKYLESFSERFNVASELQNLKTKIKRNTNLLVIRNTIQVYKKYQIDGKKEIQVNWSLSTWICSRDDVEPASHLLGCPEHCLHC